MSTQDGRSPGAELAASPAAPLVSRSSSSLEARLLAGVVLAPLVVAGLVTAWLVLSYRHHRDVAASNAVNVATLLGEDLAASLDRIDLALQSVADEYQDQLADGLPDQAELDAVLDRQRSRARDLASLRVADATGMVRLGAPGWPKAIDVGDRPFFAALRSDPAMGLYVSGPVVGRFLHEPVLLLSRRIEAPDGSFAGVVTGSIALTHLSQMLSAADVGPLGIITLRGADNGLLASNRDVGARFGERNISPQLQAHLAAGHGSGTYDATSSLDGVRRVYAFAKVKGYPLFVVAGLGRDDFLAEWWRLLGGGAALAMFFAVVCAVAAVQGLRALRRRARYERLLVEQSESLRESEQRFRTVFQTTPDSITLSRLADGCFVTVNEGFSRLTGWTEDEVRGRRSPELGIWDDPAARDRFFEAIRTRGAVKNQEARVRTRTGDIVEGLISAQVVEVGGQQMVLAITRDIDDRKRAERERDRLREQVQQAQKLESIGQLAGGIAHDFNNLLTVILSCKETMRAELDAEAPIDREALEDIGAAGERARDLTLQLLAFARKQVAAAVRMDLNAVVHESEKLLRRTLREDVALVVSLQEPLWPVWCDPVQIQQILLNLALNARDAMPSGGTLTIETRNLTSPEDPAALDGCWVQLVVGDTGVGMSATVQEHLFEPFFTTKPKGQGTGLGLAMVHGIVAQSGGRIRVESEPGRGTRFELRFPRTDRTPASAPRTRAVPSRGTETVLVVEDDPAVRSITVRTLGGAGYQILSAADAREARALVDGRLAGVGLLVTDVVMPGESGRALASELRRTRPDLPVLYVSGYASDALGPGDADGPSTRFLAKPFTPSTLLERVRHLLDELR